MKSSPSGEDRRQYRRVHAPVTCRPSGVVARMLQQQQPQDISLGGMRIYASEDVKKGTRLELELFLPDGTSVFARVEVVWTDKLPPSAPARYDVGLRFTDIAPADQRRLGEVLDESPEAP